MWLASCYAASDEPRGYWLAHCAERLAMHQCPRWIEWVDTLPETLTGKIERAKLRDRTCRTVPYAVCRQRTRPNEKELMIDERWRVDTKSRIQGKP